MTTPLSIRTYPAEPLKQLIRKHVDHNYGSVQELARAICDHLQLKEVSALRFLTRILAADEVKETIAERCCSAMYYHAGEVWGWDAVMSK